MQLEVHQRFHDRLTEDVILRKSDLAQVLQTWSYKHFISIFPFKSL